MTLPTSPRAAFASEDEVRVAYTAWLTDTDPRLPQDYSTAPGTYVRPSDSGYVFLAEVLRPWHDDSFTSGTQYANGFWRDVRDLGYGTPAFTEAVTGDASDPTVATFVQQYGALPDNDPHGSITHGYADTRWTQIDVSVQTAFLAMPERIRETWRELYQRALDENGFNHAGVTAGQFLVNAYGYSTENFFRWARRLNVTTVDGTPIVPSGDSSPTLAQQVHALLDTPTNEWPFEIRQAVRDAALDYEVEVHGNTREFADGNIGHVLDATPGTYWAEQEFHMAARFRQALRDGRLLYGEAVTAAPTTTTTPEVTTFDFDMSAETLNNDRADLLHDYRAAVDAYIAYKVSRGTVESWLRYYFLGETDMVDVETWRGIGEPVQIDHADAFLAWARDHRYLFTPTTPEVTTDTVTDSTPSVIPIGPEHPGWHDFCNRMAEVATRNGMCPEYDRIARQMGMETRKERVTYRITLEVPLDVERGGAADIASLRAAARTALETATASGTRRLEASRTQITA